jgi:hypothetical protein
LLTTLKKSYSAEFLAFDGRSVPSYLEHALLTCIAKESCFGKFLFYLAPARETFGKISNFVKYI